MCHAICAICAVSVLLSAGAPLSHAAENEGKIRVLLTYGGHGFDQKAFFAMFDELPGVEYTKVSLPESADLLKPGLEKEYDVIVRYDMVGQFTPEQRQAFVELLGKGIGLVALHHNLGAHRGWDEYARIIGGKFAFAPWELDGKSQPKSTFAHGQEIAVSVADKDHPISQGLSDFTVHDETYGRYYTSPEAKVLLTTDHPKSDAELAWVLRYGNSRVFYLLLGHDNHAWKQPPYRKLLLRGIRWAAEE